MPSVWVQNYFFKADLIYLYHNVSWQWEAPWAVGLVGRDEPNLQNRKLNLQKRMPNKTLWRTAALEWCETSQRCCHFYHNWWCSLHCAAHIWLFGLGTAIPHNTKLSLISVQVPDVTNIVFFLCEGRGWNVETSISIFEFYTSLVSPFKRDCVLSTSIQNMQEIAWQCKG